MYYLVKVKYEALNDRNGLYRIRYEDYLVAAADVSSAEQKIKKEFQDSLTPFSVVSVSVSNILGVIL